MGGRPTAQKLQRRGRAGVALTSTAPGDLGWWAAFVGSTDQGFEQPLDAGLGVAASVSSE